MPEIEIDDPTQIKLTHPTEKSSVLVSLKGATVLSWKIFSNELLYLSPTADSNIENLNTPIRGGIPLVFPLFGPNRDTAAYPKLPKHGFARNSVWTYVESKPTEDGDLDSLFELESNDTTLAMWPFKFKLQLKILLGMTYLQTTIAVVNREEEKEMPFHFLFHNYLHTDDLDKAVVTGLKGIDYKDSLDGSICTEKSALTPIIGETDRIYKRHVKDDTGRYRNEEMIALGDGGNCDITLKAINLYDTVVWNPYDNHKFTDMPDGDYKKFVCVELGTVSEQVKLQPKQTYVGAQRLVLRILSKYSEEVRKQHATQANQLMKEEAKKIKAILPAKSQERPQETKSEQDPQPNNGEINQ